MDQLVQVELWVVAIFCAMWVVGGLVNWIMLGLLTRMASELRKIMEAWGKEQS